MVKVLSVNGKIPLVDGKAISATGGGGSTVELDTTLTQSGKAADAKAVGDALAGKQNTISDLEAIRTGASKGATALQSVPSTYRTASAQDTIDSGKVDKVTGKGLSTNDYTDAAKAKVDALAPVATSGSYDDLTNKPTIPTALPNPNALTFTGAVTGSYDGSAPLSVEIPSGGGGGASTGEWRLVCDITLEENISKLVISEDSDGNPLSLSLFTAFIESEPIVGSTTNPACQFAIGNKASDIVWGGKLYVGLKGAPKETESKVYNYVTSQRFGEQIIMRCAISLDYGSSAMELNTAGEKRGGLKFESGELVKAPTAITHLGLVSWQNPMLGAGSRIRIWGVDA